MIWNESPNLPLEIGEARAHEKLRQSSNRILPELNELIESRGPSLPLTKRTKLESPT